MMFTLAKIAAVVGGTVLPAGAGAVAIGGVGIDTRLLQQLDQPLFVALTGGVRDGHEFLPAAVSAGAAGALVSHAVDSPLPQVVVDDTGVALSELAAYWRRNMPAYIVAITGSNGKTTVKEMLYRIIVEAVGAERVICSSGNLNNHLGVPLTLLRLRKWHEYAVVEAGMDHAGELTALSAIIKPQVALINNAQRAHIGNFDSLDGIARAKGELLSGLSPDGIAVLNGDDAHFSLWYELAKQAGVKKVVSFRGDNNNNIHPLNDALVVGKFTSDGIQVVYFKGYDEGAMVIEELVIRLAVPGVHNKCNALAAAAVALKLPLSVDAIMNGLSEYDGTGGRLFSIALADGGALIDDTYNANPDSAAAAVCVLDELAAARGGRALMIMGDMLALGDSAAAAHAALVEECAARGVRLFGVGELMGAALADGGGEHFTDRDALVARAAAFAGEGRCCVLVKGSRGMRMEGVVQGLREVLPLAGDDGGEAG